MRQTDITLDLSAIMKIENIAENWRAHGFVVIPGFLAAQEIDQLRRICDHVLEQVIEEEVRFCGPDARARVV